MRRRPGARIGRGQRHAVAFDGSDRQARGRLIRTLVAGPVALVDVPGVIERDGSTSARLVADLCREGLAVATADGSTLELPR